MPNHVYNTMSVTGSREALKAFAEKAKHEDREFSYWNFVTPPQEALDSGEYWETNGFIKGERKGDTPNNWYNFNNREWGTKWDTYDVYAENRGDNEWQVSFTSAWSPPMPVFEAMVGQHPDLEFSFSWEEEQGWGGEATGTRGDFYVDREWDIPDSHADHVERDRLDSCLCAYYDDPKEWYRDCPREEVPEHDGCNCSHHKKPETATA